MASLLGNAPTKKSIKVFNGETSFLSESMDEMDERMIEYKAETDPDLVASSSMPSRDLSICSSRESERRIHEEPGLLELIKSSTLSQIDPLCSLVPCSIASEDMPISCDPHKGVAKNYGEKVTEPIRGAHSKELNEEVVLSDVQEMPLRLLAGGSSVPPKNSAEVHLVSCRKQFTSLRHYSTLLPDPNNYKPVPSQSMVNQLMQFSPAERNNTYLMSNKTDYEFFLKPVGRGTSVNGSQDDRDPGSNDLGRIKGTSIGLAKDVDIGASIDLYDSMGQPIIVSNKKRRIRACKQTLGSGDEDESPEKSSFSQKRKTKMVNLGNEVECGNLTHIPLHSDPADRQNVGKKRVRFLEAKSSMDMTKRSDRLRSKYRTHGKFLIYSLICSFIFLFHLFSILLDA